MKQVIQNYKTGALELKEVPRPVCPDNGLLIKTTRSLISIGTEKLMIGVARKNLVGKAKARPDLVKRVLDKVKAEGIAETAKQVFARLDTPTALGYSLAGEIVAVGKDIKRAKDKMGDDDFKKGERVAVVGSDIASHAQYVTARPDDVVILSQNVSDDEAAFAALGGIAMQAINTVPDLARGDSVAIIGMGLLGQIAAQILKARGIKTYGIDIDQQQLTDAMKLGLDEAGDASASHPKNAFDATLIFASTSSNEPLETAAQITKKHGTVVASGFVGLNIPREPFYDKQLRFVVSHSWGWSARDTVPQFIKLIEQDKIRIKPMITHRFAFTQAQRAYETLMKGDERMVGVLFEYGKDEAGNSGKAGKAANTKINEHADPQSSARPIGIGLIGAGLFAKGTLLPILTSNKRLNLRGVATAHGSSAEHVASSFGFQYATTDYKKILNDKSVHAVIIATRHNLHARMIVEALKAGKHVYCEKPLAINEDELKKVDASVKKYPDQRLMIGFNRRFAPLAREAKKFIGSQAPMMILMRVNIGHLDIGSWVYSGEGGGNIIGEMGHFVDLASYFAGASVKNVSVHAINSDKASIKAQDNLNVTLIHENGILTTIFYSSMGARSYERELIEIYAGNNVAAIHNFKSLTLASEKGKKIIRKSGIDRGHKAELKSFCDSVIDTKALAPVDFEEYKNTTETIFRITHL